MLLHVDRRKFSMKPTEFEIGGIKKRFTNLTTVKNLDAKQIAACLTVGQTVQPGVCPYSEETRKRAKRERQKRTLPGNLFSWTI